MANILLTGIATLDIINSVDHYPNEDEELRSISQRISRGGNAANTAAVLYQLKHNCYLLTTLANDLSGNFIQKDLDSYNIQFNKHAIIDNAATPTSYVTLNTRNGSRTIIHHRDLAELDFDTFNHLAIDSYDWFHFEGRNITETKLMLDKARQTNKPVSLEVEKNREHIDNLFPYADILMFSKNYAQSQGHQSAESFLKTLSSKYPNKIMTCTWSTDGAWLYENNIIQHSPAHIPQTIVDTLGAGDTFNAGIINALLHKKCMTDALSEACKLAGQKCGQLGFNL